MCQSNPLCFGFFYERADCSAMGEGVDIGVCWLIADPVIRFSQEGASGGMLCGRLPLSEQTMNPAIAVPASERPI